MKSPLLLFLTALVALVSTPLARPQSPDPKFDEIKARHDRGESITPEERSYAQGVMAQRNQQQAAQRNRDYALQHPPRDFTGLVPLTDLGSEMYHEQPGGLYPNGKNTPPPSHANAGLQIARAIMPLDTEGHPSGDGRIVFLTVGMSNTTQESQVFQRLATADPDLNPRLVILDGAQGGQTATVTAKSDANYWTINAARLRSSGVTANQVQVVWLKQANAGPTLPFPSEARKLQADLVQTLHNLHDKFPNLRIAYVSSRTYGGYASTPLNPEPHAYETGFAVKWLIADQIAGQAELNYDPTKGPVRAPWLSWGAYLWTDGTKGRKDGFVWARDDCGPDGTHPSESGRKKVAELLLKFFKNEVTSQPWFLKATP